MRVSEKNLAVGVGVGVGAALASWWAWRKLTAPAFPHTWEEVGEVSELTIYPLKSARGIPVKDAQATIYGLASDLMEDRSFMVMNDKGAFITSRNSGTMATIGTHMQGQTLTLKAKGFEDISVDIERDLKHQPVVEVTMRGVVIPGIDCGDEVAKWLTHVLFKGETKVRLIYKGDVVKNRPAPKPVNFEFPQIRKTDRVIYADKSSYMLGCQSSLDDLNSRLAVPVLMENFRPNIVVKGSPAFDEDDWVYVKIGQVVLRRLMPCSRCVVVTVDPETGERHPEMEPLKTLKGYRLLSDPPKLAKIWEAKPIWGITMGIDDVGHIAVGDKVFAARASVHPHLKGF